MPKGSGYSGQTQGDSYKKPSTSRNGAYGYVSQRYAGAKTPNMQSWNSYKSEPERGGSIKGGRGGGMGKSSAGSDY